LSFPSSNSTRGTNINSILFLKFPFFLLKIVSLRKSKNVPVLNFNKDFKFFFFYFVESFLELLRNKKNASNKVDIVIN